MQHFNTGNRTDQVDKLRQRYARSAPVRLTGLLEEVKGLAAVQMGDDMANESTQNYKYGSDGDDRKPRFAPPQKQKRQKFMRIKLQ